MSTYKKPQKEWYMRNRDIKNRKLRLRRQAIKRLLENDEIRKELMEIEKELTDNC